ncbi:hypothetical protein PCE1_000911 [Barthelona sp. PCE]
MEYIVDRESFKTSEDIQTLFEESEPNSIFFFTPGKYKVSSIELTKPCHIVGIDAESMEEENPEHEIPLFVSSSDFHFSIMCNDIIFENIMFTFTDRSVIEASLMIFGSNIIFRNCTFGFGSIIFEQAEDVLFENCDFSFGQTPQGLVHNNSKVLYKNCAMKGGIECISILSSSVEIEYCQFVGGPGCGIVVKDSESTLFLIQTVMSKYDTAIVFQDVRDAKVEFADTIINSCGVAILVANNSAVDVADLIIHESSRVGIMVMTGSTLKLKESVVKHCFSLSLAVVEGSQLFVDDCMIHQHVAQGCYIMNSNGILNMKNTSVRGGSPGVRITDTGIAVLEDVSFDGCHIGLVVDEDSTVTTKECRIVECKTAVVLREPSPKSCFEFDLFSGSTGIHISGRVPVIKQSMISNFDTGVYLSEDSEVELNDCIIEACRVAVLPSKNSKLVSSKCKYTYSKVAGILARDALFTMDSIGDRFIHNTTGLLLSHGANVSVNDGLFEEEDVGIRVNAVSSSIINATMNKCKIGVAVDAKGEINGAITAIECETGIVVDKGTVRSDIVCDNCSIGVVCEYGTVDVKKCSLSECKCGMRCMKSSGMHFDEININKCDTGIVTDESIITIGVSNFDSKNFSLVGAKSTVEVGRMELRHGMILADDESSISTMGRGCTHKQLDTYTIAIRP